MIEPTSDAELMVRVADGDWSAFETIYRRYRPLVFRYAMRITGRQLAAEEVAQDAFLSLWTGVRHYDPDRGVLSTWLYSLVRNRGIDALRREARHDRSATLDEALISSLESDERTEERVVKHDQSRHVRQLLSALPSEQREVITLAYFGGLSHTEIASKMALPLGTVKGRQRLALAKLRRTMVGDASVLTG